MLPATPPADFNPALILLLHSDSADAVTRALLDRRARLDWPLAAISSRQLLDAVDFDAIWTTAAGDRIDPQRTALINRLPMSDRLDPGGNSTADDTPTRQAIWTRLRRELGRFRYASSLPTATSIMGCHGSLLDQWQDLPRLAPGLRVPDHATPALPNVLHGRVFTVNRWTPYSLGQPLDAALAAGALLPDAVRLDYVLPAGQLVHLAQVGNRMFFPHLPPTLTPQQREAMVGVASALARVSPIRILEHAFFVGDGMPVLYSSCPVPVLSGGHALYPELVQQGLRNDIQTWRGRHRP